VRLFHRRTVEPPLLSDAEMAKLNEEIFEEPVSVERLFAIYGSVPGVNPRDHEWVMDRRMMTRIRLLTDTRGSALFAPSAATMSAAFTLLGLPIRVEPFAKLAIRERVTS
jgi:Phage capsid family.